MMKYKFASHKSQITLLLLMVLLGGIKAWGQTEISSLSEITDATGSYTLASNFSTSGTPANGIGSSSTNPFKGTIDGGLVTITGTWNKPLFDYVEDATIKNVIIQEVSVSTSANAGAIAANASGATRIYNCGILGGTVGGSGNVGGLVGFLDGTSRVINCYSYANITSGSVRAGIVGYNNFASKYNNLKTMVMNCMFYGDISIGDNLYPIYGGEEISNDYKASTANRLNNYNYFLYEAPFSAQRKITKYNCALAAEKRFLVRFEFYRHLVNSTRELAAWYATGSTANAHETMAKWVYDKSIAPYPILKVQGKYPSVVNYNPDYTYDTTTGQKVNRSSVSERNNGKLLGTLTVNISIGSGAPTGAEIKSGKSQITLNRTDKDTINYNYNYDKVQLPYYNDVGTKNYTENKVVTGWKVTVSGGSTNFTTTDYDAPNYNFADRNCTGKDNYATSGRIFSQGAYFNVPEGVTSINIEPYWGKAAYLSDACYDRYGYNTTDNLTQVGGGQRYTNGNTYSINGSDQVVYTTASNALNALTGVSSPTVYDYAVVLVGNYHHHATEGKKGPEISSDTKPFTIMSIDLNEDDEPDYCLIYRSGKNMPISPIRFDFITVPGMVMAHKNATNGDLGIPGNCTPKGWFEITTTGLIKYGQFEHSYNSKALAPVIFMGGVIDQFVANNTGTTEAYNNKTKYMLFGDNVWFKMLSNGGHMDKTQPTPHRPISITGGEFESLYLSGYFRPDATACTAGSGDNNAECYIDGGKLGEVAGAGQENISGNITWLIDHADIKSFFGGGLKVIENGSQITGNINTTIKNSYVGLFCGGPKFGDMASTKSVTTTATDCVFGTYFGAGYGGTSIYRECPKDFNQFEAKNYDFNSWIANSYDNSGKASYRGKYSSGKGVACGYEYELFGGSAGNVGRLYLKYASFSLAKTNHVTSTLTGCTITGNYYGGGSLGKVAGDATSTLTNCTVNGSVFGAGFSATIPSAGVMALGGYTLNGVPTNPNYNETTGVYEKADPPATTDYTWTHVASLNNGNQALIDDGYTIKTTEDLTSLGTVTGSVTLNVNGNTVIEGNVFDKDGNVIERTGGAYGGGDASAALGDTKVNIEGDASSNIYNVFGGGNKADVSGDVEVNIKSGVIGNDVYGGGALANTNVMNTETTPPDPLKTTKVNLTGGTITNNVYGGGLGKLPVGTEGNEGYVAGVEAKVYGNVTVELNKEVADDAKGCIVKGNIFGCNNLNGTPKGDVTVHIYKTQNVNATRITNPAEGEQTAKVAGRYDVSAVYGGGNLAAYEPTDLVNGKTNVIIDGCERTSIKQVYGGGNAASTPATSVTVNGTYEIEELFGGGNGKDDIVINGVTKPNPGANVGFKDYSAVEDDERWDTKEERETNADFIANYVYGSGKAGVNIYGGTVHRVFGGSNTKGNVRETAVTLLDEQSDCDFCVDEAYGGGKSAPMDAEAQLLLACIPGLKAAYGGAEAADIHSNVTLNITNGTFDRVFGGNNISGTIDGNIEINIEETGCKPLIIGELYGGGNRAAYSIYGYKQVTEGEGDEAITRWVAIEDAYDPEALTGDNIHADPQVNVKSFTSIGSIYGGGYGATAVMVGSPWVNINEVVGSPATTPNTGDFDENGYKGKTKTIDGHSVTLPSHKNGKIGAIGNVFGGGNAAKVIGDTHVNIGNLSTIDYVTKVSGESTPRTGMTVVGADIRSNVYGGGNEAEVTGDTHVQIGEKIVPASTPEPAPTPTPEP